MAPPPPRAALRMPWSHILSQGLANRSLLSSLAPLLTNTHLPRAPLGPSFSLWKVRELCWLPSKSPPTPHPSSGGVQGGHPHPP